MSDTTSSSSRMGSTPAQTPALTGSNPNFSNNPLIGGSFNANNPLFIPNIPQPMNGMIKTYDTAHRSFTRPYSAKTVFFYKEGDHYFTGVRVPISKSRYRNMDSLLDDLNLNIPLPFGVRRLHTPFGRTPIESIDQLQHLGKYVASSSKTGRGVDIDAVEKHQQKMREIAQKRWEKFNEQQSSLTRLHNGKWKSKTLGLFLPLTAKQIFFILNGHPGRLYRIIINPYRKFDFDGILEEVSQGLGIAICKLYSFTGERIKNIEDLMDIKENRILAVPRHERPIFPTGIHKESSNASISSEVTSLPPINRLNMFHHQTRPPFISARSTTQYALKLPPRPAAIRNNHSIERSPIARDSRVPAAVAIAPQRRTFNYHRTAQPPFIPQIASTSRARVAPPIQPFAKGAQNRRVMSLKPRRTLPYQQSNRIGLPASTLLVAASSATSKTSTTPSASVEENDSDSGRPRSTDFEEATEEQSSDSDVLGYEEEEEDDDDYPDVNHVMSDNESLVSPPPSRASNVNQTPPSTSAHTPASTRPPSAISNALAANEERRNEAAVTIQAHVRGHLTRKRVNRKPRPDTPGATKEIIADAEEEQKGFEILAQKPYDHDYSEPEQSEHSDDSIRGELESESEAEEGEEADDDNENVEILNEYDNNNERRRQEAAITIQKNWRGFNVRKNLKQHSVNAMVHPSEEEFEESFEDDEGEVRLESEMAVPQEQAELINGENVFTYTAAIITGNRWAADTESDLYIILFGDEGQSEKHYLRQEFINWLQSDDPKFKQGKTDEFVIATKYLGQLRKITIGHEHPGYGGGVFIDQIIITENAEEESRRYLFQCYKWFDSGQVDGKLERTLMCTALYHIGSANTSKSRGRWELLLHNGNTEGLGGTSSSLTIYGYGVNGMSRSVDIYDSTLANVPSVSLIQVDFGEDIGNLIKMRIEIDGNGVNPDYFLNYVEMKDIDTDERIEINVNSWLKWESKEKGAQAFRELVIFRGLSDTLPLFTYDGKMRIIPTKIPLCSPSIKLELCGENGESGIFPASIANTEGKKDKFDVSFRVEAVSVGRVLAMRIYFDPTEKGELIFEGLAEMQKLVDKTGLDTPIGTDFLISYVIVRESLHAPYRTVLGQSRIQPRRDNVPDDSFVKELRMTSMEGLSTKIPKKKASKKKTPTWVVSMILDDDSSLLPEITLCGEKLNQKMKCLDLTPSDNILGYQLKDSEIGPLRKVRVSIDHGLRLNAPGKDIEQDLSLKNKVFIKKIRVVDAVNGDELRFPVANIEMFEYSVYEFPAIWPDIPPLQNVNYELTVSTGESQYTSPFFVHINIYGEFGDTGFRYLGEEDPIKPSEFPHDSQNVFQLEAVSLGEITNIDLYVDNVIDDFIWECQEIVVPDPLSMGVFYAFRFDEPFTPKLLKQSAIVSPLTAAL